MHINILSPLVQHCQKFYLSPFEMIFSNFSLLYKTHVIALYMDIHYSWQLIYNCKGYAKNSKLHNNFNRWKFNMELVTHLINWDMKRIYDTDKKTNKL